MNRLSQHSWFGFLQEGHRSGDHRARTLMICLAGILSLHSLFLGYRPPLSQSIAATVIPLQPVVRAALFWEEGCPYCSGIIDYFLPPLQAKYGSQLEILFIQVLTQEDAESLYAVASAYGIPTDAVGVPFLIIGNRALIGSTNIRNELPGLINLYLAQGGVDYPQIDALAPLLATGKGEAHSLRAFTPASADDTAPTLVPAATNLLKPLTKQPRSNGFGLAIAVMVGMVAALAYAGVQAWRSIQPDNPPSLSPSFEKWRNLAFLALSLIGLGVAGYLAYVETQRVPAVCGLVGDCNKVQTSPYARLFGVLPVGVFGIHGYLALLAAWGLNRLYPQRLSRLAVLAIFGMTLFGTLFSFYLTAVEVLVIKAVCSWCIASAILMTLLFLLSLGPALGNLIGEPYTEEDSQ